MMSVGPGAWAVYYESGSDRLELEYPPEPGPNQLVLFRHEMRLRRMRASVVESARLIDEQLAASGFRFKPAMLTLTYRDDVEYSPRQISALLQHVRKWLKRRGARFVAYVWVMELTQRGRPHYHIMIWLPKGLTIPKPDKQRWWPWGHTKIEWARSAVGYLAKYASKLQGQELSFPERARLHGNGGLDTSGRRVRRWRLAPQWVREAFDYEDDPRRAEGGGYVSRLTGEKHPSPYQLIGRARNWSWLLFEKDPLLSSS